MGDRSDSFRLKAEECRNLARAAYEDNWRQALEAIAADFDREAARLDAEEMLIKNGPSQTSFEA